MKINLWYTTSMSAMANIYNHVSEIYENADPFSIKDSSHNLARSQIRSFFTDSSCSPKQLIDLGVGAGEFLEKIHTLYPETCFAGIDISAEMLSKTAKKINLRTAVTSAQNVDLHFNKKEFDVVVAHSILAYIDLNTLLDKVAGLLTDDGVCSFITTTHHSYPVFQSFFARANKSWNPVRRVPGFFYNLAMGKTKVPASKNQMNELFSRKGFEVVARQQIEIDVHFGSAEELMHFGWVGGWFVNAVDFNYLPLKVSMPLITYFLKFIMPFPRSDQHICEVVLIRRK